MKPFTPKKKSSADGYPEHYGRGTMLPQGLSSLYLGFFTRSSPKGEQLMSAEEEVRHASKQFYTALNRMANGDAGLMASAWSHGPDVTALHPIDGREIGREAVKTSFEQFAQIAADGNIDLKDQLIRVEGDVAYELGVEQGECKLGGHPVAIKHRVTNIYRREGGGWRMIHHHSDTSPAMLDVLAKL